MVENSRKIKEPRNFSTIRCARPSTRPGGERLVVWLEFLVINTFLINVRWAMKSQNTPFNESLSRGLQFVCERENSVHQRSLVLRTGVQQTCLRANSDRLRVCVRESQVWRLKSPLLSLATDALMVRRPVLYSLLDLLCSLTFNYTSPNPTLTTPWPYKSLYSIQMVTYCLKSYSTTHIRSYVKWAVHRYAIGGV